MCSVTRGFVLPSLLDIVFFTSALSTVKHYRPTRNLNKKSEWHNMKGVVCQKNVSRDISNYAWAGGERTMAVCSFCSGREVHHCWMEIGEKEYECRTGMTSTVNHLV